MYEIQVTRVKLSNFISSSKFLNTNQMLICLFPSMHFYALHIFSGSQAIRGYICLMATLKFIYFLKLNE